MGHPGSVLRNQEFVISPREERQGGLYHSVVVENRP